MWFAAEVNTSIRPGWFWHASENDKVRPLRDMMHIYYNSVGGNATFLLNIPPTNEGLLHENDVKRLREIGADAVLIGETLMRSPDKKGMLEILRSEC